jgi:hypothetical protein
MNQQKTQKPLLTRIIELLTLTVALMAIAAGLLPNSPLFNAAIRNQPVCFIILSVWALLLLVWIIREAQSMAGVRFSRKDIIVIATMLAITLAYYTYSILTRRFLYYWDYAVYYRMQLAIAIRFQSTGLFASLIEVIRSILYGDYSQFISIFLAAPFALTPQTANWFVAVSAITILPLLYWVIAIFIKITERMLQPKRSEFFLIGGMALAAGFPVIHRALLYGQPDLFGLILAFAIIIITIQYDFSKTDLKRYLFIIGLTIMVIASRRWYIFWAIAYYACYGLVLTIRMLQGRRWDSFKRLLLFGLSAAAIIAVALLPMVLRIFRADYAYHYSYYNVGGFPAELKRQWQYLGAGLVITFLAGFLFGIFRKQTRAFSILALANALLTMLLFTRIQNMGRHHMLILVPAYLLLMLLCLAGISRFETKSVYRISATIFLGFYVANAVFCGASSSSSQVPAKFLFSNLSLELPRRDDMEQVETLNRWIIENCTKTDPAYMIPHGYPYNPDVFRNSDLPDWSVNARLSYGSAILGTHPFPEGLLLAKYVLTCDPFCNASIAGKYNSAFLSEIPQKHLVEIRQFDMGNGYTFFVYQRVQPTDSEEIMFYRDYFSTEDTLYPDMFSGVLDRILKDIQ